MKKLKTLILLCDRQGADMSNDEDGDSGPSTREMLGETVGLSNGYKVRTVLHGRTFQGFRVLGTQAATLSTICHAEVEVCSRVVAAPYYHTTKVVCMHHLTQRHPAWRMMFSPALLQVHFPCNDEPGTQKHLEEAKELTQKYTHKCAPPGSSRVQGCRPYHEP